MWWLSTVDSYTGIMCVTPSPEPPTSRLSVRSKRSSLTSPTTSSWTKSFPKTPLSVATGDVQAANVVVEYGRLVHGDNVCHTVTGIHNNRTADFETVRQIKEKLAYVSYDLELDKKLSEDTSHTGLVNVNQVRLEKALGGLEALAADADDTTVGQ
jgi:hypothetical protein